MADATKTRPNQETNNEKWWHRYIHPEMIPAKVTYLLCEGYMGSIMPILNIFFVTMGLSPAQAGLITGISFGVAAIFPPIWSSVIETTGHRRRIFIILCIGTASTVFSMPWIASSIADFQFNVTCDHHARHVPGPLLHFRKMEGCRMIRYLKNSSTLFSTLLILNIVSRIFFVTLPSYVDSIVVKVVKTRVRPTTYGEQRVFGVVGFGIANFIAGLAVDHYRPHNMSPFVAAFYVFLPFVILLIPAGYVLIGQIPNNTSDNERCNERNITADFSKHMCSFLKRFETFMLLITVTVSGTALNMLFNFLFLFMRDLAAPKMAVTLTFLICMLTQLVAFPLSAKLIQYIGSPVPVIIVGIFSYLPRFLMMSYITNPWLALPINLLEPIGLAFNWAAQIELTYQIAPKEITLTAINIIATIHFVASSAIANIIGGIIYNKYGGRQLYRGTGVICGIWSIVLVLYYGSKYYVKRRTSVERVSKIGYDNEVAMNRA